MAWGVYYRQFHGRVPWWAEPSDMVQEGVERLIQQAGHPRMAEDVFAFRAIKYSMVEYLRKSAMSGKQLTTESGKEVPEIIDPEEFIIEELERIIGLRKMRPRMPPNP